MSIQFYKIKKTLLQFSSLSNNHTVFISPQTFIPNFIPMLQKLLIVKLYTQKKINYAYYLHSFLHQIHHNPRHLLREELQ